MRVPDNTGSKLKSSSHHLTHMKRTYHTQKGIFMLVSPSPTSSYTTHPSILSSPTYMIPNSPNPFSTSLSTLPNHSSWNLSSPPQARIAPCKWSRTKATRLTRCTGSE